MRHAATQSAAGTQRHVIIVASVSPASTASAPSRLIRADGGQAGGGRAHRSRDYAGASALVELQYRRNDVAFTRGSFRLRGENGGRAPERSSRTAPGAWSLFGDEIDAALSEFDPLTGERHGQKLEEIHIYANSHYVTPRPTLAQAIRHQGRARRNRLEELTNGRKAAGVPSACSSAAPFDLEMMETTGFCKSASRTTPAICPAAVPGEPRHRRYSNTCPENALLIIDESHVTVPQIGGMERGDFAPQIHPRRIRLPPAVLPWTTAPSASKNSKRFRTGQIVYVSATPGPYELDQELRHHRRTNHSPHRPRSTPR